MLAKYFINDQREIITVCSYADAKVERSTIDKMRAQFINRIIFISPCTIKNMQYALNEKIHCIAMERNLGFSDINKVIFDYYKASQLAVKTLVEKDHNNIGFVGVDPKSTSPEETIEAGDRDRYRGYKNAYVKYKLHIPLQSVSLLSKYDTREAYNATIQMFARTITPSALIVTNATHLIGVLQALYHINVRIPHDISIVVLTEFYSDILSPRISCITYNFDSMLEFVNSILFSNKQQIGKDITMPVYYKDKDSVNNYKKQ